MERLYVFLIRNDIWIYILCFLGLIWYSSELLRASRSLRRAMFGLERETGLRARNSALVFVLVFALIAGAVAYVNLRIAPTLPAELLKPPTPTPDPFSLPAPSEFLGSPTPPGSPTSPIAATVTLPAGLPAVAPDIATPSFTTTVTVVAPNPLILPTTTAVVAGCSPTVNVTDPRDGDTVVGTVAFFGSANIPGFAFFDMEISGPQTNDRWASLLGRRVSQRIEDGLLATANLSEWAPGDYQVRLLVTNEDGVLTNQCVFTITLSRQ